MKINHRITADEDDPFWLEIQYLGLKHKGGVLNITEDQAEWPEVERLVMDYKGSYPPGDWTSNVYTKRELDSAEWLEVSATGSQGDPKPWNWFEQTYDPRSCRTCGIHGDQLIPYRFSGEPKAKSHQFLQLNGIYDTLFVRAEAREGLTHAGITGIDFGPLLVSAKGKVSEEAMQMHILGTLPPALDVTALQPVTCMPNNEEDHQVDLVFLDWDPAEDDELSERIAASDGEEKSPYCGQVKYHAAQRGPLRFDRGALAGAPNVVRSHEWFGSGGLAFRRVLVSQKFRQMVVGSKWRGLVFEPVELID